MSKRSLRDIFGLGDTLDPFGLGDAVEKFDAAIAKLQIKSLEARLETMKRKSQYLIDVAYNRALADLAGSDDERIDEARRLRRPLRFEAEFSKKKGGA